MRTYVKTWENRCYSKGIPDEVSGKLMKSMRVPSYKAIAVAILKNDLHLRALGFGDDEGVLAKELREKRKREISDQINLFR